MSCKEYKNQNESNNLNATYAWLMYASNYRNGGTCCGDSSSGGSGGSGAQGPRGATGATGPRGATGVQGATGPRGVTGANGVGVTGARGATGATGATGLRGATGAQGATGPSGSGSGAGATGPRGATGVTGATGLRGATGVTGLRGVTGATGAQGATGAPGTAGGSAVAVQYDPAGAAQYVPGQMVIYNNQLYIARVSNPQGTPNTTGDYINLGGWISGYSGAAFPPGSSANNPIPYSFPSASTYKQGQYVSANGAVYLVERDSPRGLPGVSGDYTQVNV